MSGETILVVEDQPDIQLTIRLSLELSGYRVISASRAEEALALLGNGRPSVVLLDLSLPGIGGWELLTMLGDDGRLADLRVIVLSAHAGRDVSDRAASLGAFTHLTKPFDIEVLLKTIRSALEAASP